MKKIARERYYENFTVHKAKPHAAERYQSIDKTDMSNQLRSDKIAGKSRFCTRSILKSTKILHIRGGEEGRDDVIVVQVMG